MLHSEHNEINTFFRFRNENFLLNGVGMVTTYDSFTGPLKNWIKLRI